MDTQRLHLTASHSSQKYKLCKGWVEYDIDGKLSGGGAVESDRHEQ